jgi:hypothetical protein
MSYVELFEFIKYTYKACPLMYREQYV